LTPVAVDESVQIPLRAELHNNVLRKRRFDVVFKADDVDVVELSEELDFHGDCVGESCVQSGRDLHSLDSEYLQNAKIPTVRMSPKLWQCFSKDKEKRNEGKNST
jgi:hypothetical protein